MDFNKIPLFQMVTNKMDWLGQRQKVLARNIANVNTPNFKPQDVKQPDFAEAVRQSAPGATAGSTSMGGSTIALTTTNPAHMPAIPAPEDDLGRFEVNNPDGPKRPNGNTVVLENELGKVGRTAMDYELMTNVYRKYVSMFKTALGRGRSG